MTNDELMQLKALAEAATPGPWSYNGNCRFGVWQNEGKFYVFEAGGHADAAYTAAASPDVILALIAKVEAAPANGAVGEMPELRMLMREAAFMLQNSMFQFCDTGDKAVDLAQRIGAALTSRSLKNALSDAQIAGLWKESGKNGGDTTASMVTHFARAIEAASGPNAALVAFIHKTQSILAKHLPPDGPEAKTTISELLTLLDGPESRAALAAVGEGL